MEYSLACMTIKHALINIYTHFYSKEPSKEVNTTTFANECFLLEK